MLPFMVNKHYQFSGRRWSSLADSNHSNVAFDDIVCLWDKAK